MTKTSPPTRMARVRHQLSRDGIISVSDSPDYRRALAELARTGAAVRVLPGIYLHADVAADPWLRLTAVQRWAPGSVLIGDAAQWVHYGSDRYPHPVTGRPVGFPPVVEVCLNRRLRPQATARVQFGAVAPRHVRHLVRNERGAVMALMQPSPGRIPVIDQTMHATMAVPTDGGRLLGQLLIDRITTMDMVREAVASLSHAPGAALRQRVIHDLSGDAWSQPERLLHQELRRQGIRGWTANAPVWTAGYEWYADVLFTRHRVIVEVDGFAFHSSREQFEKDRFRQNALTLAGYRVLRFTWNMITQDMAGVIATLRAALAR